MSSSSSTTSLKGTFHRKPLPFPAVPFSSKTGIRYFKEALELNYMKIYFPLSESFQTQADPSYCGLGSLTMVLNAMLLDPLRVWKGVWRWFDEVNILTCCTTHDHVKTSGITLAEVNCLANCSGADSQIKYASDILETEFRDDIISCCLEKDVDAERSEMVYCLVSYSRSKLNQTGQGHFSPIGGYHKPSDMVLIMDVARFKYPPHWVPLTDLYHAMLDIDSESSKSRGYLLLRLPNQSENVTCVDEESGEIKYSETNRCAVLNCCPNPQKRSKTSE